MYAALHHRDGDIAQLADDELAGVAGDGRAREAGDFRVGNSRGEGELVGEGAGGGAGDEGDFWAQLRARLDVFCGARRAGEIRGEGRGARARGHWVLVVNVEERSLT